MEHLDLLLVQRREKNLSTGKSSIAAINIYIELPECNPLITNLGFGADAFLMPIWYLLFGGMG